MLRTIRKYGIQLFMASCVMVVTCSTLHADFGPMPMSLKGAPVPEVPGLLDGNNPIIIDKASAIALGKALFWDINVGSDGIACASCHFHAGADRRTRNVISPTGRNSSLPKEFSQARDGSQLGPHSELKKGDFPFFQTDDPMNPLGAPVYINNDVVSSSGTFGGTYRDAEAFLERNDECDRDVDPVFHIGSVGARKVEPRNTPTVINAVFNFRNFWDGRANNIFNGSSPWGDRDPNAGVWIKLPDGSFTKRRLRLLNSSLASVSVAPPLDDFEMSCHGRTFPELGRKLFYRNPLEHQQVHWNDSVLGNLANSAPNRLRRGLKTRYYQMIKKAFHPKYWNDTPDARFGFPPASSASHSIPYSQTEANFAMFFGLSLQMYMATLISDDSPFDRSEVDEHGEPIGLSESAQRGMDFFRDAHCALCHIGPNFTASAVITNSILQKTNPHAFGNELFRISTMNVVTHLPLTAGMMFQDTGFAGTGVTPVENDPGLGATDPFGNPLSFSDQYIQILAGNLSGAVDPFVVNVRPCDLDTAVALDRDRPHPLLFTRSDGIQKQFQSTEGCFNASGAFIPTVATARAELAKPDRRRLLSAAKGSYKIPSLRNIELTGPYMHNGGMATLEEVLEFYIRGGNFTTPPKEFGKVFSQPELRLSAERRTDLINFLKSLTDERVLYERAPFDHPELRIPNGHASGAVRNPISSSLAEDEWLTIPAVGAAGSTKPITPFERYLR